MEHINKKKKPLILRFISYYKPHIWWFILDLVCAFIVALIDVTYPLVSRYLLQTLLPQGDAIAHTFFLIVGVLLCAYVTRSALMYIVTYRGHVLGVKMEVDMRHELFEHLQKLSFSFYDKSRTGVLMSRCTHDLFEITELAHHGPEDLFISIVTLIGASISMFTIKWQLALVLIAAIPIMITFVIILRKRLGRASRKQKETVGIINASIESAISGARVAKAFVNEEYEVNKFDTNNKAYVNAKTEYYKTMGTFTGGMEFFTTILQVIIIAVGGYMFMIGDIDAVTLFTFSLYVSSFTSPIKKLAAFAEMLTNGMTGFARFTEIVDIEPEIQDKQNAIKLGRVKGDIEFKNVTFAYNDSNNVLENISFSVQNGKKVALVGHSGGGKTTICHLLPRFYEVNDGEITVDGNNINDVTMKSLRTNIGIVQQDVFLFADTVKENIRYGRPEATDEEIIEAAKLAEIHDDIMNMPNGYDTLVGERGIMLSGGQKQRISIARIFLKNPPILILDEATSALDSATEAKITQAFDKLSTGRTTLVIAHRLSTVRNADNIIVVDKKHIIEQGTHEQLLNADGEYAQLCKAQNSFEQY